MTRFARQFSLNVLALILAVALIGLGFGHRMTLQAPLDLSAYAMPDGTLPELCHDSADHGMKDQAPCPLCRIVAALELPSAPRLPAVQLTPVQVIWPQLSLAATTLHMPRAPPARGPPPILIQA